MMTEQTVKIVEKLLDTGLPEDFAKEKQQLLSKLTQEPSEEAVTTYSRRKNINLKEAKERLEANYRKEVEDVEFKEIALRLSNAMKMLSPKMLGLEQRELGREEKVKKAVAMAEAAERKVDNAVEQVLKVIEKYEEETVIKLIAQINNKLNLKSIALSMVSLEEQNKLVYDELIKAQDEIRKMKENTLKNRIKRFFGLK